MVVLVSGMTLGLLGAVLGIAAGVSVSAFFAARQRALVEELRRNNWREPRMKSATWTEYEEEYEYDEDDDDRPRRPRKRTSSSTAKKVTGAVSGVKKTPSRDEPPEAAYPSTEESRE